MSVEYTKAMLADLQGRDKVTFEDAKAFADKYDISVRSVISKCRALEVAYQPKTANTSKAPKEVKETKAEIVADIQSAIGLEFRNLGNLVMDDLNMLRDFINEA